MRGDSHGSQGNSFTSVICFYSFDIRIYFSLQAGVTAMRFNHGGNLLASGSKDTDLIVWDVIQESGLYKLKVKRTDIIKRTTRRVYYSF